MQNEIESEGDGKSNTIKNDREMNGLVHEIDV